jgi:hypothetical protein
MSLVESGKLRIGFGWLGVFVRCIPHDGAALSAG